MFTVRKFDGDDAHSWAVFRKADLPKRRGIIFYGEARPIVTGLSRREADDYKRRLESAADSYSRRLRAS